MKTDQSFCEPLPKIYLQIRRGNWWEELAKATGNKMSGSGNLRLNPALIHGNDNESLTLFIQSGSVLILPPVCQFHTGTNFVIGAAKGIP